MANHEVNASRSTVSGVALSLIRWLDSPFYGKVNYFRVGGDPPATREDVQNELRNCLDGWFGDLSLVENDYGSGE
jgi:hypothetical protein